MQLSHGTRYLDLKIGRYPDKEKKYYSNHGTTAVTPLENILNDVKSFLNDTQEIVILGFHEFPVGKYNKNK